MKTKNCPFLESLRRFSDAELLQICEVACQTLKCDADTWSEKLDTDLLPLALKLIKFMEE